MIQTQSQSTSQLELADLLKQLPHVEEVQIGDFQASSLTKTNYYVKNVTTGLCVMMYDASAHVGGMAYIMLPDSEFQQTQTTGFKKPIDDSTFKACYADIALPKLWEELQRLGASVENTQCVLIGGSQLFTFGGGRGNPLNIGARNAITARTTLARMGLSIQHTEVAGNRPRHAVFLLTDGRIYVQMKGGETIKIV
jgi:chemotaxis protein CheD